MKRENLAAALAADLDTSGPRLVLVFDQDQGYGIYTGGMLYVGAPKKPKRRLHFTNLGKQLFELLKFHAKTPKETGETILEGAKAGTLYKERAYWGLAYGDSQMPVFNPAERVALYAHLEALGFVRKETKNRYAYSRPWHEFTAEFATTEQMLDTLAKL